ncbi:MAG TPA: DUF3108 domain-containing protein [Pyrinomonadaceae bacterium]|jgi:hypothetical protein|nr:DUF3108 domain-containing protein [Pyrinomonadaceae bacterium]
MDFLSRTKVLKLALAALACAAMFSNALSSGGTGSADAPAAARPLPFEPEEELFFQGDFSRLMLRGIEIAEFHFTAGRATTASSAPDNPPPAQPNIVFKGDVRAKGWFRKLFGIDFHYSQESLVDANGFLILRTTKLDEQGKRVRTSVAEFDRRADRVTWTQRNPNDANADPRVVTNTIRDAAHDIISAIYYLRAQPLAPGQSLELVVSDDGQTYRVPVRVFERKVLKTVAGRVPTLRLEVGLFGEGHLVDDRKGEMTLWLTDDARRLPVRARLDAEVGTLDIKLKKFTGGISRQK